MIFPNTTISETLMGDFRYLAISKNREKHVIFILIQDTLNEDNFFTREILSWEDGEILYLSSLFLLALF